MSPQQSSQLDQAMAEWYLRFQSENLDPEMTLSAFAAELRNIAGQPGAGASAEGLKALSSSDPEALAQTNSDPGRRSNDVSVADRLASYTRWLEGEEGQRNTS